MQSTEFVESKEATPTNRHRKAASTNTVHACFVAAISLLACLASTSLCAPLVYALHLSGDFSYVCMADLLEFQQFWETHTTPKRMFAIFMCIEMIITRAVAARELYQCLQLITLKPRTVRSLKVALFYLWTTVGFVVLLDIGVLMWAFLNPLPCDEILSEDAASTVELRKFRTMHPLCVQSSDIENVLRYSHILNTVLLLTLSAVVTALMRTTATSYPSAPPEVPPPPSRFAPGGIYAPSAPPEVPPPQPSAPPKESLSSFIWHVFAKH